MTRFHGIATLCCCSFLLLVGCGKPAAPKPSPVKGTVLLDGKALKEGKITFDPADGLPPITTEIVEGEFKTDVRPGNHKVAIFAFRKVPDASGMAENAGKMSEVNYIPERFSSQTTLEKEVKAGEPGEFKFEITSR